MKKFNYLLLLVFVFLVSKLDVHASNFVVDYDSGNFKYSAWASFYNLPSNDYYVKVSTSSDDTHNYFSSSTLTSVPASSGIALGLLVEGGFIKDNVYTIGIYVDGGGGNASAYTTNTQRVLVGENADYLYSAELLNTFTTNGVYVSRGNSTVFVNSGSYISYTFRAPITGPYLILSFTTQTTQTAKWWFNSYTYVDHGSKAPSSQEIADSLNSSFVDLKDHVDSSLGNINNSITNSFNSVSNTILDVNRNINSAINNSINTINNSLDNVLYEFNEGLDDVNNSINEVNNSLESMESSINSSLNMVESSINSSIDTMRSEVNDSLNSDDSDTTSGKCGVLCKLKGIFTGILNLPQNIWNLIKIGFDTLGNTIGGFFKDLISIFVPEKECTMSRNLFNNKSTPHSQSSSIPNVEITDTGIKLSNNRSSSGGKTPNKIYIIDTVKKLDGKTLSVSSKTSGHYSIGYLYYSGSSWNELYELDSHNFKVDSSRTNGAGNVVLYLFNDYNSSVEFSEIMVNEGSSIPYEEYGKEVCTESETFLGFIGNFFKSIISGILELPVKLVELLIDAIKSLFVPTDDQLYDIINESKELTENFGFVGESMNFFINIFTSLLGLVSTNGCVELPEFTIGETSLFEAHTFWQAQNVCLGDNAILSNNIETIRTITSIVLVGLFLNFAVSKFFSILNKNDDDRSTGDARNTGGTV